MKARAFAVLFAASLFAAPALAQDVATAEALFNKGVADLQAGKFDTACPAINESYRLDPRGGTLFTLAECYAKAGKIASAAARYDDYLSLYSRLSPADQAKQNGRDRKAADAKAALTPKVPLLTVTLPKDAPAGTLVRRDDTTLTGPSIGLALPVDPGEHVITTQAPGGASTETRVTIAASEKKSVEAKVVAELAGGELVKGPGGGIDHPGYQPPDSGPTNDHRGSGQRTAGVVVMGVGAAGVILGAVTGGLALGKKSTVSDNCDTTSKVCRNQAGKDAVDSAKTLGTVSTVGFIGGAVLAAAGAVVYFTAPKSIQAGIIDIGPRSAMIGASGRF